MAASASDYFQKVGASTATTLSSPGYSTGNASINIASTTNWPTDTGVHFAIDETETVAGEDVRTDGTLNIFRGTVSGATQITNLTYVGGDANRDYSAGATTRVYIIVNDDRENRLVDGLLVAHDQDGTLKADSVVTANITDANVTTAKIADASVTNAKLADGSVTGEKINTGSIIVAGGVPATSDSTGASYSDWGYNTTITVPSWANRALVTSSVNSFVSVSSTTIGNARTVIGSDNGIDSAVLSQTDTAIFNDKRSMTWTESITLTGTGSVTLKMQVKETAGSGAIRINNSSYQSWHITFLKA